MNSPPLKIGNKTINYVRSTKVLGIWLDEDLIFKEHSRKTVNKCQQKWGLLTKSTSRNHGLNVRSLCLLLKTTVLTKLHYGSPLWLHKNLHTFKGFWNKATLNPNRDLTELALQLPPFNIQLESLPVKFMCKVLKDQVPITSVLAQVDGSLYAVFHEQLTAIRKFIAWKNDIHRSIRNIDLLSSKTLKAAFYNKEDISSFLEYQWSQNIRKRYT